MLNIDASPHQAMKDGCTSIHQNIACAMAALLSNSAQGRRRKSGVTSQCIFVDLEKKTIPFYHLEDMQRGFTEVWCKSLKKTTSRDKTIL